MEEEICGALNADHPIFIMVGLNEDSLEVEGLGLSLIDQEIIEEYLQKSL